MLALPAELQLEVLSYCDRETIATLRLLHSTWLDTTTDILFADHSTCLFRWSFDRLAELSRSRLASRVKSVTLYAHAIGECWQWEGSWEPALEWGGHYVACYPDFESHLIYHIQGQGGAMYLAGFVYRVPKEEWLQAWSTYQAFRKAQAELDAEDFDVFNEALKRLPQLRSLSVCRFPKDDFDPTTRHGRKKVTWSIENKTLTLAREMAWTVASSWRSSPEIFSKLIPCVASLKLDRLHIQQQYDYCWDVEQLRPMQQRLTELKLDLHADYFDRSEGERRRNAMTNAIKSLLVSPKLRSLTLLDYPIGDQGLHTEFMWEMAYNSFFSSYTWPDLRSLTLEIALTNECFEGLFKRHDIKHLDMQRCSVSEPLSFLKAIPKLATLTSVAIRVLMQDMSVPHYFGNGLDEAARLWLCAKSEEEPDWTPTCTEVPWYAGHAAYHANSDTELDEHYSQSQDDDMGYTLEW